jgi:hypothetical protein
MDYVTAKINLGGDVGNVMCRGPDRPVSWPEVTVLQFLHGEDAVYDCDFVRTDPSTSQNEKRRLLGIYGAEVINTLFPGARPLMELEFPGDKTVAVQARPPKRAPPTREQRERDIAQDEENAIELPLLKKG